MATGIKQQDRQNAIAGWLFMVPALAVFAVFVVIPIIFAVIVSFTDWNGISPPNRVSVRRPGQLQEGLAAAWHHPDGLLPGAEEHDLLRHVRGSGTDDFGNGHGYCHQPAASQIQAVLPRLLLLSVDHFVDRHQPAVHAALPEGWRHQLFAQQTDFRRLAVSGLAERPAWAVPHHPGRVWCDGPDDPGLVDHYDNRWCAPVELDQRPKRVADGDHDLEHVDDYWHHDADLCRGSTRRATPGLRGCCHRRRQCLADIPQDYPPSAEAHDLLRGHAGPDRNIPGVRPGLRHEQWRTCQDDTHDRIHGLPRRFPQQRHGVERQSPSSCSSSSSPSRWSSAGSPKGGRLRRIMS